MITNRIIDIIIGILAIIVIPVQLVSTFILGLLVTLTFGLLLIPINLIWVVLFLGPLLGLSYIYERIAILRPFVAIVGIILAVIGDVYVCIMPSMGEMDSRYAKLIICQTFPYTYSYIQFHRDKLNIGENEILKNILSRISKTEPLRDYIYRLLDPQD